MPDEQEKINFVATPQSLSTPETYTYTDEDGACIEVSFIPTATGNA